MTKILGGDSHSIFPLIKGKNSLSPHICHIRLDFEGGCFRRDAVYVRQAEYAQLKASHAQQRAESEQIKAQIKASQTQQKAEYKQQKTAYEQQKAAYEQQKTAYDQLREMVMNMATHSGTCAPNPFWLYNHQPPPPGSPPSPPAPPLY